MIFSIIVSTILIAKSYGQWSQTYGSVAGNYEFTANPGEHISKICIEESNVIEGIQIWFSDHEDVWGSIEPLWYGRPDTDGTHSTSCYETSSDNECFNAVSGAYGADLDRLQFTTSTGATSQLWGGDGGIPFTLQGSTNECITGIEIYWSCCDVPIKSIRFYGLTETALPAPTPSPSLQCPLYNEGNPSDDGALLCADEDGNCVGPGRVYYGSEIYGQEWTYKDVAIHDAIDCTNTAFGCDPVPGYPKQCYIIVDTECDNIFYGNPVTSTGDHDPAGELCATENGGDCSGPGRIFYGYGLFWSYRDLYPGEGISCSNEGFECDPTPGAQKKCYKKTYEFVMVNFQKLSILKTISDGNNGGTVAEWNMNTIDNDPSITMNVDFYDVWGSWNNGCSLNMVPNDFGNTLQLGRFALDDTECKPPTSTESSTGFYDCFINGDNPPFAIVSKDVYQNGLKYTFNFQVGDFDANNEFDNGPTFDFTYTENEHTSIDEFKDNPVIERYFTRTGPEGRIARLFARYQLIQLTGASMVDIQTCN